MWADALHKAAVASPNLRPIDHVVIGGAVDGAPLVVDALVCWMYAVQDLTVVVLPTSLLNVEEFCHGKNITQKVTIKLGEIYSFS